MATLKSNTIRKINNIKMSATTLKIIRFIIAVIGISSFVHAYNNSSILFLVFGIIAIVISLFFKRMFIQKKISDGMSNEN
jgi:hypothetical protein